MIDTRSDFRRSLRSLRVEGVLLLLRTRRRSHQFRLLASGLWLARPGEELFPLFDDSSLRGAVKDCVVPECRELDAQTYGTLDNLLTLPNQS